MYLKYIIVKETSTDIIGTAQYVNEELTLPK